MAQDAQVQDILLQLPRPPKVVVTAGMPYVNGILHLGHLAGAFVPADIYARWWRIVVGAENVLFVSGTDDHGVAALGAAQQAGKPTREFIQHIRSQHQKTLQNYDISLDTYASTSDPQHLEDHRLHCHEFLHALAHQGQLSVRSTAQYYDEKLECFLPDRWVQGRCPVCNHEGAYSQECGHCGAYYEPGALIDPISVLSGGVPVLRNTRHIWWDMMPLAPHLWQHVQDSRRTFPKAAYQQLCGEIAPGVVLHDGAVAMERQDVLKSQLPTFKKIHRRGGGTVLQFSSYADLEQAREVLKTEGIAHAVRCDWAQRTLSRDTTWGVPLPEGLGLGAEERERKSFYVWPDSLIAPLSFSRRALQDRGEGAEAYLRYWQDPQAQRHQFIGVDNLYFYGIMQSALWMAASAACSAASSAAPSWQMSRIHSRFHLQVSGEKMSKSKGNYYTADELLAEKGYSSDEVRWFLASLSLREKSSNWDFKAFDERNSFLAGPMAAAFEKPIAAAHSQFGGKVPAGRLIERVSVATEKLTRSYVKFMPHAQYPQFLGVLENYARIINSIFHTHKPHDDRHPLQQREDGLYSSFYILKNLLIWLYPFAPSTMENLRECLNLSPSVYTIRELGTGMPAHHSIGVLRPFFSGSPKAQHSSQEKL